MKYDGNTREVFPHWDNTLGKEWERDSEQVFFREKLSGALTFIADEFDIITGEPIETEFVLEIDESNDRGATWSPFFRGYFFQTSADEVNMDDKRLTVEIEPNDRYRKIMSRMDKEYNLIELAPKIVRLSYRVRAILQFYTQTANYVTNILGGTYWETPVDAVPTTHADLSGTFGFEIINQQGFVPNDSVLVIGSAAGIYNATPDTTGVPLAEWEFSDGTYRIRAESFVGDDRYVMRRISDGIIVGNRRIIDGPFGGYYQNVNPYQGKQFNFESLMVYARVISNENTVNDYSGASIATTSRPGTDIVTLSGYDKMAGVNIPNTLLNISNATQSTPTEYGATAYDETLYYSEYLDPNEKTYPIGRSAWGRYAVWFQYDQAVRDMEDANFGSESIRDNYLLGDAIAAILDGTGITHELTPTYSQFLYDVVLKGFNWHPVLTPKTNLLVGDYDQAAKTAPIRLGEIMEMLRIALNCFWYVDASDRLIIEHRHFFDMGLDYSTPQTTTDVTKLIETRTGLPWTFATNRFKYQRPEIPERIEFEWMDDQSRPFDGFPIEVASSFTENGQVERRQIAKFSTDIEYLRITGEGASKDGFLLTFCDQNTATSYTVPIVSVVLNTKETLILQNGWGAFVYLHPYFHKYNAPAKDLVVNETATTAITTKPIREQEIDFPMQANLDPMKLITTGIGSGNIQKMTLNLSSRMINATVRL